MTDRERLATSAPRSLLADRGFWRANRPFGVSVLGGVVLIFAFSSLTYPRAGDPAGWIAVAIYGILVVGLGIAAHGLARSEVDDAIAQLVEERASAQLGEVKGRLKDRIFLDELESDLLPHNPSHDQGAIRVFQYLIQEAREHKFLDTAAAVESLAGTGVGELFRLQALQKIAVQVGIMGTFAGLIVALAHLGRAGAAAELAPQSVAALLDALHAAFGASLAGLEVAIILGVLALVLRHRHEAFLKHAETAAAAVVSLARRSVNRDDFVLELEQVREVVARLADRVREQSRETEAQTDVIRTGLGRLAGIKLDLDSFLHQVHGEQDKVLAEMKSVYEIVSPQRTAKELAAAMEQANRELAAAWRAELERALGALGGLDKLDDGLRALEQAGQRMWDELKAQTQEAAAAGAGWRQAVADLAQLTDTMARVRTEGAALAVVPAGAEPARLDSSLSAVAERLEGFGRQLAESTAALRALAVVGATPVPRQRRERAPLRRRPAAWLSRRESGLVQRAREGLASLGRMVSREWHERREVK